MRSLTRDRDECGLSSSTGRCVLRLDDVQIRDENDVILNVILTNCLTLLRHLLKVCDGSTSVPILELP